MKKRVEAGKVVKTHGVRGEIILEPWCDDAYFLLSEKLFYIGDRDRVAEAEGARVHKGRLCLKIRGIDSIEQAEGLLNEIFYIDKKPEKLEKGVYYVDDLLGMPVFDADTGDCYGRILNVLKTGANDVYEVGGEGYKTVFIPAIKQVVTGVSLKAGRMEIRPLKGLFDI